MKVKDIFSYNIDIDKNAYINWRTNKHINNMIVTSKGFMISKLLIEFNKNLFGGTV